jgi:ribose 5-phosphate isomerase A
MRWSGRSATRLEWSGEIVNREQKERVAERIARAVQDGAVVGVGSGSTVFLGLQAIGRRIAEEGLRIRAIPASHEVELACTALGIPTTTLLRERPDWSFDGADEVDPAGNLIKGRGGAMFREKLLMASSPKTYIVVDDSKLVRALGEKFPVPVEVYPAALHLVEERLARLAARQVELRLAKGKDGPVVTESGNLILDVRFDAIGADLEREIKLLPGVVESGLFLGYAVEVLVAQ